MITDYRHINYKPYKGKIPFLTENGNMTSIYGDWMETFVFWKDSCEFHASLKFINFDNKANWVLKDTENGVEYIMFPTEVMNLILNAHLDEGKVAGMWTFVKRGSCYGIRLIQEIR